MKKSFRAVVALAVVSICAALLTVSAQTAPAKVLTAKDIDAYVTNFDKIQAALDALGDKYDEYFPESFEDEDGDQMDLSASFRRLREVKAPAEIEAIMKKNGLGDKGFLKFIVISYCAGISVMEASFELYSAQYADNAEMMGYFKEAMGNVEAMKSAVHASDLALVAARQDEIMPLMGLEENY